eukprot:scaffold18990_cov152-Isochrysis_galbana.AAC.3
MESTSAHHPCRHCNVDSRHPTAQKPHSFLAAAAGGGAPSFLKEHTIHQMQHDLSIILAAKEAGDRSVPAKMQEVCALVMLRPAHPPSN